MVKLKHTLRLGLVNWLPLLLASLSPARSQAFTSSTVVSAENSGFISLKTTVQICTGVMVGDDTFISSARCFSGSEVRHPELVGWVMGSKNSDDNRVQEISLSDFYPNAPPGLAVGRLQRPPFGAGTTTHFALYKGTNASIAGTAPGPSLDCYSYGRTSTSELRGYGKALAHASYTANGWSGFQGVNISGPILDFTDAGGVCFSNARQGGNGLRGKAGGEVAAIIESSAHVLLLGENARAWVTNFNTQFEIMSVRSGKCLEVPGATHANGAPIMQAPCDGSRQQRFRIRPEYGSQTFQIRTVNSAFDAVDVTRGHIEQCLSIGNLNWDNGAAVIQSPCAGVLTNPLQIPSDLVADQKWSIYLIRNGDGKLQLRNVNSYKCLATPDWAVPANRAMQWDCNNAWDDQQFRINAVNFGTDVALDTHSLVGGYERYLDVWGGLASAGAAINSYPNVGVANQRFLISGAPVRSYSFISSEHTGFSKFVTGLGGYNTGIVQNSFLGDNSQQWRFEWRPTGYFIRARSDATLA